MHKKVMEIWGRDFNIDVFFECFGDEEPTKYQEELLLLLDEKAINKSLDEVKKYCLEDELFEGEQPISNIFKYVIPTGIYVRRDNNLKELDLLCDYKFDIEHGLAIVFSDNVFQKIVQQTSL